MQHVGGSAAVGTARELRDGSKCGGRGWVWAWLKMRESGACVNNFWGGKQSQGSLAPDLAGVSLDANAPWCQAKQVGASPHLEQFCHRLLASQAYQVSRESSQASLVTRSRAHPKLEDPPYSTVLQVSSQLSLTTLTKRCPQNHIHIMSAGFYNLALLQYPNTNLKR